MNGILYVTEFVREPSALFDHLVETIAWDERMAARKTASFGVAYNYSQIDYPQAEFPAEIAQIVEQLAPVAGFRANNCLVNYYPDGKSTMGYHSDRTDILAPGTGIAIVSLGETRTLKFRNVNDKEAFLEYPLTNGSLLCMSQEVQEEWQHAIRKSDTGNGRISLTFRKIAS